MFGQGRQKLLYTIQIFKVFKYVHHHTIQINQQLDVIVSPVYYPDVYLQPNMFRASSRPLSGSQQLLLLYLDSNVNGIYFNSFTFGVGKVRI